MNITMDELEALVDQVQLRSAHGGHGSQRRVQAAVALQHTAPVHKCQ